MDDLRAGLRLSITLEQGLCQKDFLDIRNHGCDENQGYRWRRQLDGAAPLQQSCRSTSVFAQMFAEMHIAAVE